MKDRYGSDIDELDDSSDDSEDTTEDEDGEELTPAVDVAILRTLARIKRKDPAIYESGKDVFEGTPTVSHISIRKPENSKRSSRKPSPLPLPARRSRTR